MSTEFPLNRRQFLGTLAVGTAAALAAPGAVLAAEQPRRTVCAFAKPLQSLSHDDLADVVAGLGFDGIEATVRPGGQVLPERVEEDLPRLVEALKRRGLEITVMASGVNSTSQPHTEKVLRTAARLGIRRYRMDYWRYDLKRDVPPQLEALRPVVRDLAALNRELGMTALYQNHAGVNYVGAPLWDIHALLKDQDPRDIALAFDIRHAAAEGGQSWPIQFNLVRPHIGAVFVKDFIWESGKTRHVPLGEGWVDTRFFALLRESAFTGPVSLHVEYLTAEDPAGEVAAALKRDLATLRSRLAG